MTYTAHSQTLDAGALLLLPTETVWGVAARADNTAAIDTLYAAKGRSFNKPLALCVGNFAQAHAFGHFDRAAKTLAQRHWPGPLTIVVSATEKAIAAFDPRALGQVGPQKTIAFRCPDTDWREPLCAAPLVLTSANKSGEADALTEKEARAAITQASAVSSSGQLSGKPSTIISSLNGTLSILRQGELELDLDTVFGHCK